MSKKSGLFAMPVKEFSDSLLYMDLEDMVDIKAVIWDIGGVIMRTEDLGPRDQLAADLGVTRDYLNNLVFGGKLGTRAQKGELTQRELWDYVRSQLKLGSSEYTDLRERFFGGDMLDTELIDFIRTLKPQFRVGIISNAWSELPSVLAEWGIADAFDVVVGSGDEGVMKPDPRIYQIALERLSIQPKEAIFVDDFIENITGAKKLGINAVHFQSREQALQELKTLLKV